MMWLQMVSMVLDVLAGLVAGTCLLRFVMQWQRIPFQQPIGRFVFAVTDWLVMPLRKIVPTRSGWDVSSLLGAWLVKLLQFGLLWALAGGRGELAWLPWVSLLGLVQLVVSGLSAFVLILAVMSWVNPGSPLHALSDRLCAPFLRPFRRWIPLLGGVDLSPLALLLVLQMLQMLGMVLAQLQMGWLY